VKRRWRFYRTPAGRRVIDEFLDALPLFDASEVAAAMKEVRADGRDDSYRLLFATEGRKSRILLGLHVMPKHAQKTPNQDLRKAERRLIEWRQRGKALRPRP
jgi:phage-related protein